MNNDSLELLAVGDIMLGDHPVCFGHGVRSSIDKHGFEYLFEDVAKIFRKADFVFGNLETVLADSDLSSGQLEKDELRGREIYGRGLASVGFNIMSVANNHAMQHGHDAFKTTIKSLYDNGINSVGLDDNGLSNTVIVKKNDIEIVFIGYSLRPEKHSSQKPLYAQASFENIRAQVKELKKRYNIVVISLHWGEEYLNYPSIEQIEMAHCLVDAGADLILGHHPHVLQGLERYNGSYIAYSLGNFIFDKWQVNPRETMILKVIFEPKGLLSIDYIPVFINRRFQPIQAIDHVKKRILSHMNRYQQNIIETQTAGFREKQMEDYHAAAAKAYRNFRKESYIYFLLHIYKYNPKTIFQSLKRFLYRRISTKI